MYNKPLNLGQTYETQSGIVVIPIKRLSEDRAIFVSEEFWPTSFVRWTFNTTQENDIDLWHGDYYFTLEDALEGTDDVPVERVGQIRIMYSLYCPECCSYHESTFCITTHTSVQELMEHLEDDRICPDCGHKAPVKNITVRDESHLYDIPLYSGPVN